MYAKIFTQILDSSLVEDYPARCVFMDLLLLADKHGVVDMTPEAIARRTNAPLKVVKAAIAKLSEVDPQSRTKDEDGRRIILLDDHRDWGWQIVNFVHYHKMQSEEDRREYMREYMREKRREKPLAPVSTPLALLTHANANANANKDANKDKDKSKSCLENKIPLTFGIQNEQADALIAFVLKQLSPPGDPQGKSASSLRKMLTKYTGTEPRVFVKRCCLEVQSIVREKAQLERERSAHRIRNPMGLFVNWLKKQCI